MIEIKLNLETLQDNEISPNQFVFCLLCSENKQDLAYLITGIEELKDLEVMQSYGWLKILDQPNPIVKVWNVLIRQKFLDLIEIKKQDKALMEIINSYPPKGSRNGVSVKLYPDSGKGREQLEKKIKGIYGKDLEKHSKLLSAVKNYAEYLRKSGSYPKDLVSFLSPNYWERWIEVVKDDRKSTGATGI